MKESRESTKGWTPKRSKDTIRYEKDVHDVMKVSAYHDGKLDLNVVQSCMTSGALQIEFNRRDKKHVLDELAHKIQRSRKLPGCGTRTKLINEIRREKRKLRRQDLSNLMKTQELNEWKRSAMQSLFVAGECAPDRDSWEEGIRRHMCEKFSNDPNSVQVQHARLQCFLSMANGCGVAGVEISTHDFLTKFGKFTKLQTLWEGDCCCGDVPCFGSGMSDCVVLTVQ